MRIKSIHIKGLFDTFDHFIPFNQEDRITIIHAPNGFGKTIILKMLYGLLKMDFSIFDRIPFESFIVSLDSGNEIEVIQVEEKRAEKYKYDIFFSEEGINNVKIKLLEPYKAKASIRGYRDYVELQKTFEYKEKEWIKLMSQAKSQFISHLQNENNIPSWYFPIIYDLDVHLIETQRLLVIDDEAISNSKNISKEFDIMTDSVSKYAIELKKLIEDTLNEYATTSQNLERTFPNRLITQKKQENLTIEHIKNELNNLEERRKKLQEVGLWDTDNSQDMNFQIPENTDSSSLNVLNLYIQDAKQKLAVFDGLEQKIALFKNIINSRFQFKTLNIDKKKGFFFLTHKNENLDSNDLSSGEQHQLVLLYEMLFKVKENDLVLIDEPEISLHIMWQEKFLDDLVKIIELNPFDVLIATHAPEIINDRLDLTIGLSKNKENV